MSTLRCLGNANGLMNECSPAHLLQPPDHRLEHRLRLNAREQARHCQRAQAKQSRTSGAEWSKTAAGSLACSAEECILGVIEASPVKRPTPALLGGQAARAPLQRKAAEATAAEVIGGGHANFWRSALKACVFDSPNGDVEGVRSSLTKITQQRIWCGCKAGASRRSRTLEFSGKRDWRSSFPISDNDRHPALRLVLYTFPARLHSQPSRLAQSPTPNAHQEYHHLPKSKLLLPKMHKIAPRMPLFQPLSHDRA